MAKKKNMYYSIRHDALKWSCEKAAREANMDPSKLRRIEENQPPTPDDIIALAKAYKTPSLCNYYCSHDCPIGRDIVPVVEMTENLSQIVMGLLSSLNAAEKKKDKLIDICADGVISSGEVLDFVAIQEELEKISIAVETLQIWCKRMTQRDRVDVLDNLYKETWNDRNEKNKV